MPKATKPTRSSAPEWNCGALKPQQDDEEILAGTQPQEVLSKIMLICDDTTGVFFFRYNQKLYLRVVEQG
jgi:hypothetical protein